MKCPRSTPPKPAKTPDWQKTNYANLIRYMPSGMYFARIRIQGKMIRRSLKTNQLSLAEQRLADFARPEHKKQPPCKLTP